MKKFILGSMVGAMALCGVLSAANNEVFDPKSAKEHIVIKVEMLNEKGNKDVGEVVAVQTKYGVAFFPNLKGLEAGVHGFHVHANADCGATEKGLGMKAGGHWDPKKTENHSLPWDDNGHMGDLPALYVEKDGSANSPVLAPKIKKLKEIKNHALMIHFGGDNHSDHPAALGGGGARMACGVIE
ncbi:superoxide dismutase [Helicobacter sp. MIT 00-7814]|uniref:superoxide dismutase family protein n=1 Tax=unclassified Helicobacter TaxID=2593540 RepID=UPI000E1F8B22|nr:superoxide dismutase [Helicobacter sp. MIT 99-10781]RDU54088.1 superoxide dismutase [Helicobacter sp. MIT 00-7814]